jgi:hypothetical protein
MSYGAGLYVLLSLAAGLLFVVVFARGRPRPLAVCGALVALAYCPTASAVFNDPSSSYWQCSATWPEPKGWEYQHVLAECLRNRASWSVEVLVFALPPLVFCVVGAGWARRRRASRSIAILPVLASGPSLILILAIARGAMAMPVDDPRWQAGYVREWLAAGSTRSDGGGVCFDFLRVERELRGLMAPGEFTQAQELCRALCEVSAKRHHFNPGILEDLCLRRADRLSEDGLTPQGSR